MQITDPFVLVSDVLIIPVEDLDDVTRCKCDCAAGDFFVSKPNSRLPSSVVNRPVADLLRSFRTPRTVVEVAIEISMARGQNPESALEEIYAVLTQYIRNRWLVPYDAEDIADIKPSLDIGERFEGHKIISCIQILEDTEVYQLKSPDGRAVALKISRAQASVEMKEQFKREAELLQRLDADCAPAVFRSDTDARGCSYILMEWISGSFVTAAANDLRRTRGSESALELLKLCISIVRAYESVHAKGILHGDVYPKNILVGEQGQVTLIDFGAARLIDDQSPEAWPRLGVPEYFEPELAWRILTKTARNPVSAKGEQYALAAVCFLIMTGRFYLDLSPLKEEALRQIAEDTPLRLKDCGIDGWLELDTVFARALSKDGAHRFADLTEFRHALETVAIPEQLDPSPGRKWAPRSTSNAFVFSSLTPDIVLPQRIPTASISYGAAGIAMALYCASAVQGEPRLLTLAQIWAERAEHELASPNGMVSDELGIDRQSIGNGSVWFGAPGIHLVKALTSHAVGDQLSLSNALAAYDAACDCAVVSQDLTIGRAGQLLGYALVLDALHYTITHPGYAAASNPAINILSAGRSHAHALAASLEADITKYTYLGIAHGVGGMLYALLTWAEVSGDPVPESVVNGLHELAEFGQRSGRGVTIPMGPKPSARVMESWCHGSPGYVSLWAAAHRVLRDEDFLGLAEKAAWAAWETDSLGETLCCGDAGRAYAMLEAFRLGLGADWLRRAYALANQALVSRPNTEKLGYALYKGVMGAHLLSLDLSSPTQASMPLFGRDRRICH
ncbi:lanthionine synthetase LanC family protein [Paraburkholderia caribensis]|uniref:lanthionine synthetase LanC family protein n=1 Tax=Paraburkholderia caribensis TaxID=75105 RepID=UPI0034D2F6F6